VWFLENLKPDNLYKFSDPNGREKNNVDVPIALGGINGIGVMMNRGIPLLEVSILTHLTVQKRLRRKETCGFKRIGSTFG